MKGFRDWGPPILTLLIALWIACALVACGWARFNVEVLWR